MKILRPSYLVVADHDGLGLEVLFREHLRGVPGGVLPERRHGLLHGVHRLVRHLVRLVVKLLRYLKYSWSSKLSISM